MCAQNAKTAHEHEPFPVANIALGLTVPVTITATEISFKFGDGGPKARFLRCNPSLPKHDTEMIDFSHIQIIAFPWHASPYGHVIQG